ncbi:MAG: class II aldolase [Spirochaetales bacterium]|nr:MAG: class II aldolase [Spirochaetales bacterium]
MSTTSKTRKDYKQLIVNTGIEMINTGMTVGTWGNISCRDPETNLIYISPSGMNYTDIRPEHVVVMDVDLNIVDGEAEPSIEKHMHTAVYRSRADINAVVHTHPVWSTILGVVKQNLPAVSEDFAQIVGAEVEFCSTYELPGTPELGIAAVKALKNNNAVMLPNHGALSVGNDMKMALKVCRVLEKNAQIYVFARLIGHPTLFKQSDIEAMQNFARTQYGRKNSHLAGK